MLMFPRLRSALLVSASLVHVDISENRNHTGILVIRFMLKFVSSLLITGSGSFSHILSFLEALSEASF